MNVTAFDIAQRFVGLAEVPGTQSNPAILAMLKLDGDWPKDDEVPWCSAFANYVAWLLRLPRSKSLAARSWLDVGVPVTITEARVGFDVVVLWRGTLDAASGHVGFYAGHDDKAVHLLAGNQGDKVSVASFPVARVLGVRRLLDDSSNGPLVRT